MRWKVLAPAAVIVVAAATALTVVITRGDNDADDGPLHFDHDAAGLVLTGLDVKPGATYTGTVHGVLDGPEPVTVTGVRLLPVEGFPTPELYRTALITGGGEGMVRGWPRNGGGAYGSFTELIDRPVEPTRYVKILVGLRAGSQPGVYAIAGAEVDYTVDGERHRTMLYDSIQACVQRSAGKCTEQAQERANNAVLDMAGVL